MATIAARNDTSILRIENFLGLNENPDGDTTIKVGEMAEMRNFRITKDKHLQIRPGTKAVLSLADALAALGGETAQPEAETRCGGVWRGMVGEKERILAAYGGHIWEVDPKTAAATDRGTATDDTTTFFGFGGKVYLLNGHEYMSWDGGEDTAFANVEGYIPIVQTATTPAGAGTLLENVNRLNGKRRVVFSPDGTAKEFQLPETEIDEVISVEQTSAPATIKNPFFGAISIGGLSSYEVNAEAGKVTFSSAPKAGTNTLVITYRKGEGARSEVTGMRYAELFNGSNDTRVFLYGDGSNRAIYSGLDYDTGQPSAEYFPDLFEAAVGESNTPITALARHFSQLMAYKPDSAWVIRYGTVDLEDSTTTAAFYVQPVNRQIGNEAMGQVKLLENDPLTIDSGGVYQWRANNYGSITSNENNARRISDRVARTLRSFDLNRVQTFNIKREHEFWVLLGGRAVILNYANDTWYLYEGLPFSQLLEDDGELYGFCDDGRVVHFSRAYYSDCEAAIDCYAATGAMDFDRDWLLKYSPMIFVAMQPESGARVTVTVETNRRSDYPEKAVAYSLATFSHVNFGSFSFATNRKPQVQRVKMKVKKASYYRLIYKSNSASATATVLQTDVQLRYAGKVK